MEKPPFQFGLKAVFVATMAAGAALAIGLRLPPFLLVCLAISAAVTVCYMAVVVAVPFAFEKAVIQARRLWQWLRAKSRDA